MGACVMTRNPVWILEIDRTERRNSVDSEAARSLSYMLHEANGSASCRAAVLVGQSAWFCAGSDLKELAGQSPEEMAEIEETKAELARLIQQVDIPVVAAVEGFALGGGVSLAASCDIVVSSREARWHMPEVRNGWIPPWGIEPVVNRCGPVMAKQVLWGVEAMDAVQAQLVGLVDVLTDPGGARARAIAIAEQLADLPPIAARSVKRYLRDRDGSNLIAADATASQLFVKHCHTAHAQGTLARFGKK